MTDNLRYIFGYGSLIWNPGFPYAAAQQALLRGAHRRLCIYSHHHRGTKERPGLVYGLVPGGACRGMAFAVPPAEFEAVRDYLRAREQVTKVYREVERPVALSNGDQALALTYVVDTRHDQFAGRLDIAEQWRLVRDAVGISGANVDYVRNTARHLAELGIADQDLSVLMTLMEEEASIVADDQLEI